MTTSISLPAWRASAFRNPTSSTNRKRSGNEKYSCSRRWPLKDRAPYGINDSFAANPTEAIASRGSHSNQGTGRIGGGTGTPTPVPRDNPSGLRANAAVPARDKGGRARAPPADAWGAAARQR